MLQLNMEEPIRTRKEKLAGRVEQDARLDRVVQVKKGRRKSAHLSSAGKNSSLTMMKRNRKRKRTKRMGAKEGTSRAERTIQVMVEARQHQSGSERGSHFMLGSQRSHCHNKTNSGFVDSSEGVGRKGPGRMSSTTG